MLAFYLLFLQFIINLNMGKSNVFMAAKSFNKQLKQQKEETRHAEPADVEETPAQAQARAKANMKLKIESFSNIWSWIKEDNFIRKSKAKQSTAGEEGKKKLPAEGRGSTSGATGGRRRRGRWCCFGLAAVLLRSVGRRLREAEGSRKADGRGQ
nr:chaperone protein DnaJ C76, chloroplastic-like [Ipomoea batatas]